MHLITIVGVASMLLNTAFAQEDVDEVQNGGWRNQRQRGWRQEKFLGRRKHRRQAFEVNVNEYTLENTRPTASLPSEGSVYTIFDFDPSAAATGFPVSGSEDTYTLQASGVSTALEASGVVTALEASGVVTALEASGVVTALEETGVFTTLEETGIFTALEASATATTSPESTPGQIGYGYFPSTFSTKATYSTSSQNAYNYPTSGYNTTTRLYDPPSSRVYSTAPYAQNTTTAVYNPTTRAYDPSSTTTTPIGTAGTNSGAPNPYPTYGAPYGNSTSTTKCTGKKSSSTTAASYTPPVYYTTSKSASVSASASTSACTVDSTSYVTVTESVTHTVYLGAQNPGTTVLEEATTIFLSDATYDPSLAGTATIADVERSTTSSLIAEVPSIGPSDGVEGTATVTGPVAGQTGGPGGNGQYYGKQ